MIFVQWTLFPWHTSYMSQWRIMALTFFQVLKITDQNWFYSAKSGLRVLNNISEMVPRFMDRMLRYVNTSCCFLAVESWLSLPTDDCPVWGGRGEVPVCGEDPPGPRLHGRPVLAGHSPRRECPTLQSGWCLRDQWGEWTRDLATV